MNRIKEEWPLKVNHADELPIEPKEETPLIVNPVDELPLNENGQISQL